MFASASLGASILPIIALSAVGAVGIGAGLAALVSNPYMGIGALFALAALGSSIIALQEKSQKQVQEIIDLFSSKRLIKFTARRNR